MQTSLATPTGLTGEEGLSLSPDVSQMRRCEVYLQGRGNLPGPLSYWDVRQTRCSAWGHTQWLSVWESVIYLAVPLPRLASQGPLRHKHNCGPRADLLSGLGSLVRRKGRNSAHHTG